MKKLFLLFFMVLACASFAEAISLSNDFLKIDFDGQDVRIFAKEGAEPLVTLSPFWKGEITGEIVRRGWLHYKVLSLRNEQCSLAFQLMDNAPVVTMALNRGADPVSLTWDAEAVVLPDVFAENTVVTADETVGQFTLPAFVPAYVGLIRGGNAMVSVIPIKATTPAVLGGDLKQLLLSQKNLEEYRIVVQAAEGCWHKCYLPQEVGETKSIDDWTKPYEADWMASLPMEQDFLASGDGSYTNWQIVTVTKDKDGKDVVLNKQERMVMTNISSRHTWHGGFEGNYHYPVEFLDGKLQLHHTLFQVRDRVKMSSERPVYVYNLKGAKGMWDNLPSWTRYQACFYTQSIGATPATCTITELFEKIFYKSEAAERVDEIRELVGSMQLFVEGIRSRIESARGWKNDLLAFAQKELRAEPRLEAEVANLSAALADVDALYDAAAEVIQNTEVVRELSRQVVETAASDMDDDEKEDQAKLLGRKIRTIGGGQDNLAAKMRHIGKNTRFQAVKNHMASTDAAVQEFWKEVYLRTEPMLQGYFGHDGK
ncbi:MAG: hypothetical protein MJ202_02780 [Lentisphaeria bacterium]|nr:hypothetical protein [Lentisphaeria bacterium]